MPTIIQPSNSPPRGNSRRTSSIRRKVESPSSKNLTPVRSRSNAQLVCVRIPVLNLDDNTSRPTDRSSINLTKRDSQVIEGSDSHSPSENKAVRSDVARPRSGGSKVKKSLSITSKVTRSPHHSKSPKAGLSRSTSTNHGKAPKFERPPLNKIKPRGERPHDLDPSQLDEIEGKITSTSIIFSDSSIPELNSKQEDIEGVDFLARVDERCFKVLKDSELDEDSDQSDEEPHPSDRYSDAVHPQLPSPFKSPRRLSSVSPLEPSTRTTKAIRKSAGKRVGDLLSSPRGSLVSDPKSFRASPTKNQVIPEEHLEIEQPNNFEPQVVLPLLHSLLSHLSGLKPLPIRIPQEHLINSHSEEICLENPLHRIQSILDLTPCLLGLEDLELEIRSILFRSISEHEGNVLLLSGARGSGKTALVSRSLSLLSDPQTFGPNAFITIKLNGLVHNNDKVALKEMCRQLFSSLSLSNTSVNPTLDQGRRRKLETFNEELDFNNDSNSDSEREVQEDGPGLYTGQPKFTNYGEILRNLLDVLEPANPKFTTTTEEDDSHSGLDNRQDCKALVIILEDFDMFSDLDRQSFLYCLLDAVQGNKRTNGVCVVGTTCVVDCLDRLEKRVKSRCQSRIRYLNSPRTEPERIELLKSLLELHHSSILPESSPAGKNQIESFIEKWNEELDKFLNHSQVLDWLRSKFQLINDPLVQVLQDLNAMVLMLAYEVKQTGKIRLPMLRPMELFRNSGMDGKMHEKKGMTERRIVRSSAMIFSSLPWWANEMGTLEFSVLIACKHLSLIHHNGIFNLEMAWDLYRQHLKRHSLGADLNPLLDHRDHQFRVTNVRSQIYGRDAFELAWERLKRLEIIIPISILNSRMYTTTVVTSATTNKNKKHLNVAAVGGKGYELVKFVPFLTQVDLVISQLSSHLLANHLIKWAKNSSD